MTDTPQAAPGSTRLLVLGIDAASPALLDRWIDDGSLPTLAALAARGARTRTRGIEGFFIGSTWPSMYTGTNPARHGVHYLLELTPGTYALRRSERTDFVRRPPFWHALASAERRVAVLDVPLTRLEPPLGGVQVVEWGGHDSIYGFHASSDELAARVRATAGDHPVQGSCDATRTTAADYESFVARLEEGSRRKALWTRQLLQQERWDLVMQVFTEGHCAGHQCWHLHDERHPAHDPSIRGVVGDPLRRAYTAIDRAIGEVLGALGSPGDTHVLVFSAHGMSHWYGAQFLLQEILVRLGALVLPPTAPPPPPSRIREGARTVWRTLPEGVRTSIRRARSRVVKRASSPPTIAADFPRSRCFVQPNGLAVGGIRLNIAGREPEGVLASGTECDAFADWLEAALLEIVDERTGDALVKRVLRTDALYAGEHRALLPDLLVEWNDATPTGAITVAGGRGARVRASSPRIGIVEGTNDFARTGEHRPGGWLLAAGPGVGPASLPAEVSLLDLAPTITAMLGVELANVDGVPIAPLVRDAHARGRS